MLRCVTSASRLLGGNIRQHSSSSSSAPSQEKWNLVSSVCLQRKPIIVKELTKMEKQMSSMLLQVEKEQSWLSDWELQHAEDLEHIEKIKRGEIGKVGRKTTTDWEDEWKKELNSLKLSPRITAKDQSNDTKSLDRLLDSTLMLVVRQKANGNRWILPQGARADGETMRQAAERVLKERCGGDFDVQFYGNAPCGYFRYKYPKAMREKTGYVGDKVFFYKASLVKGEMKSGEGIEDYKWVGRKELKSTLPNDYLHSVELFLFDEAQIE